MGGALLALAASDVPAPVVDRPADDPVRSAMELSRSLSLVDRLAWADSDRAVDAYLRDLGGGGSVFLTSLRDPATAATAIPADGTVYAAEVELVQGAPYPPAEIGLSVREAIVWHNRTSQPLRGIALRVFANGQTEGLDGARIRGVWVDNRQASFTMDGTVLGVELPRPLPPGDRTRILIQLDEHVPAFDPRAPVHDGTITPGEIGAFGRADGWVNLGWFLPLVTPVDRRGMFDVRPLQSNTEHAMFEPAAFHVVLNLPDRYAVATTGVEVARRTDGGEATVVAVAAGVRDFAAMLVPSAGVAEADVGGVHLRVFHPADDPREGADLLTFAQEALRAFGGPFGPLQARELDVVEAPLHGLLAVDFPGLVAIDLSHQGVPYHRSAAQEWALAHEIAHQWWSVEVGSDPVMAPWLDEALSSYSAALYWSDKYGEDAVATRYELEVRSRLVELRDRGVADLPADLPSWKYDLDQFAAIVQGRGSLFFDKVRTVEGDEAFFGALRSYHDRYRGRFATADDLLAGLSAATDDPAVRVQIASLYARWIQQAHSYDDLLTEP